MTEGCLVFTKGFRYLIWRVSCTLHAVLWGRASLTYADTAYIGEYLHFRYLNMLVIYIYIYIVGTNKHLFHGPKWLSFFSNLKCLILLWELYVLPYFIFE